MRPAPSGASPAAEATRPAGEETPPTVTTEESRGAAAADSHRLTLPPDPLSPGGVDPLAQATIAANALMERTPFAIDDAGDEDDDDDDDESDESEGGTEYEDDVLDEVHFFFFWLGGTRFNRSLVCAGGRVHRGA